MRCTPGLSTWILGDVRSFVPGQVTLHGGENVALGNFSWPFTHVRVQTVCCLNTDQSRLLNQQPVKLHQNIKQKQIMNWFKAITTYTNQFESSTVCIHCNLYEFLCRPSTIIE